MRAWLLRCEHDHPSCRKNRLSNSTIPAKRVLEIATLGSEHGFGDVRVVNTSDLLFFDQRYVTLSHRWGDIQAARLLTSNLAEWRRSISTSSLPQLFLDAIGLTAAAGIHYLWIDSLCIMQDSEEDWLCESATMGVIYAHSWKTLAATGHLKPGQSIMSNQAPDDYSKFSINAGSLWWMCIDPDRFAGHVENAPLNKRAWVLQKRIMSRRIMHFTGHERHWECREASWSQTFPNAIPKWLFAQSVKSPELALGFLACILRSANWLEVLRSKDLEPNTVVYKYWCVAIEAYSRTSITFDSDKLIAISGIARALLGLFDDEYLAGLWGGRIIWELLWKAEGPPARHPKQMCPPTWSWASTMRHIKMYIHQAPSTVRYTEKHLAKVVERQVIAERGDPMGHVTFGTMQLKGPLTEVFWNGECLRHDGISLQADVAFDIDLGEPEATVVAETPAPRNEPIAELGDVWDGRFKELLIPSRSENYSLVANGPDETIPGSRLFEIELCCLSVLIKESVDDGTLAVLEGLLLAKGSNDGEYTRMGRLTTDDSATIALLQDSTDQLDETLYESYDKRRGLYRISVV